jgi:hypothetical protein
MKANELMLGDWVLDTRTNNPLRVNPFMAMMEVPEWLPIPLTPEILEKNGFGCDRNDGYAILRLEDNSELLYYFHEYKLTRFYKSEIIFRCQCVYAHQLQHALKLCGIDKNIIV